MEYKEASQYGNVLYECGNEKCNHKFYLDCVSEEHLHRGQPTRCPQCSKSWSHLALHNGVPIEERKGKSNEGLHRF